MERQVSASQAVAFFEAMLSCLQHGTVGRIQAGVAMDLIERCADVHLKKAGHC